MMTQRTTCRSDRRKAGIALVAGSIGGLLTMAAHPVASGPMAAQQALHLMALSGAVHSFAMVSIAVLVLGAIGLTRRLAALDASDASDAPAAPDRLAFAGLVFYCFAAVAIMIAAAVSGFIVPEMLQRMTSDTAAATSQWHVAIWSVFRFNQAFARIYAVAASIALGLWSLAALRHGGLGRGLAIFGCVVSPLLIVGIGSGHLSMDVHGMAAVAALQGVWFLWAGSDLYFDRPHVEG